MEQKLIKKEFDKHMIRIPLYHYLYCFVQDISDIIKSTNLNDTIGDNKYNYSHFNYCYQNIIIKYSDIGIQIGDNDLLKEYLYRYFLQIFYNFPKDEFGDVVNNPDYRLARISQIKDRKQLDSIIELCIHFKNAIYNVF